MNLYRTMTLVAFLGAATLNGQDATAPTPVSNAINAELPKWLHFSGEERARMEYIAGEGFQPVADLYLLNRFRLNMDVRATRWLKFSFQSEDARVFGQNTVPAAASQKDAMDLRLGYLQLGGEEGLAMLRAGRQSLDFGEGRLVSDGDWSNVARSYDAARLTLRHGQSKVDLFTGALVKVDPVSFDQPTPGQHFDGAYGSLGGLVPDAVIEPYMFWRMEHNYKCETGAPGNLDEKTIGFRWAGKLPLGFDYTSEIARETGSWASDAIGAWMGHWVVGETLPDARHVPRFFFEYNRASGDAASKDGKHGTFDPLFPSIHDKYGPTDLFGCSNIVYLRPGFQYTLRPGLRVAAAYDDLWLATASDGLYVSGKLFCRSSATAVTHIGQEADFQAIWALSRATQVNIGYGRLFAGEFLQRTTAGVPYNILFLSMGQRF